MPTWFKILATVVVGLMVAILLGGVLSVPYRFLKAPRGYDQPRLHYQTKNSTRLGGDDLAETAALVARAVYPSVGEATTPDVVLVFADDNWAGGLAAAPLVRALNGLLLPASAAAEVLGEWQPRGSNLLQGAQVVLVDGAAVETGGLETAELDPGGVARLLQEAGAPAQHAILVDADEPLTAIVAAPWAAWSGDLIVFDEGAAPPGIPLYTLGDVEASAAAAAIGGGSPAAVAVAFAAYHDAAAGDAGEAPFGWGFNADTTTGYRGFVIAPESEPAFGLLSANLARRGRPGPLFWSGERELPQAVNNYFFSQRAAFWATPAEGPFHHFYVLGGTELISFPAQAQADYAVEMGPYFQKGVAAGPVDMLATAWVLLGLASAVWIAFHETMYLRHQNWLMKLAWPLLALMIGPFGIPLYWLAHDRPLIKRGKMVMYDRPLWLQGMVATASAVGFGGFIMVTSGYLITLFGAPLVVGDGPAFLLGTPMILIMIINYLVAVAVAWPLFQTPMMAAMHGLSYREALPKALPLVLVSMFFAALAMDPGMWYLMMSKLPMMPMEESILWFGVMFFTVFLAFLMAWPANYYLVRTQRKGGMM